VPIKIEKKGWKRAKANFIGNGQKSAPPMVGFMYEFKIIPMANIHSFDKNFISIRKAVSTPISSGRSHHFWINLFCPLP
jgi:hypothetical protein